MSSFSFLDMNLYTVDEDEAAPSPPKKNDFSMAESARPSPQTSNAVTRELLQDIVNNIQARFDQQINRCDMLEARLNALLRYQQEQTHRKSNVYKLIFISAIALIGFCFVFKNNSKNVYFRENLPAQSYVIKTASSPMGSMQATTIPHTFISA